MRPRQVVDAVRWVMDGLIREKAQSAAIAQQYGDLVADARRRASECLSLLRQGAWMEARELAARQPALLDTLAALHDPALARWPEFCKRYGLADPPGLSVRELDELQEGLRALEKLEPLLDEWRIQNLRREPAHVRLQTLWRLIRADPAGPFWRDDARVFEEPSLVELANAFSKAMVSGRLEECWRLQGFVARKEWKNPTALKVARKWEQELQALGPKTAHDRAAEIVRLLHERFQEQDVAGAKAKVKEFEALRFFLSDTGMPISGETAATADAAMQWIELQQSEEERRRNGAARLAGLRALHGLHTATREQLEEALRAVEEVPPEEPWEEDQLAVRMRIGQFVAQERRARAVKWLSAAAVIVATGTGMAWGVMKHRANQNAERLADQAIGFLEAGRLADAEGVLDSARQLGLDKHEVIVHASASLVAAQASRLKDDQQFEVLITEAGDPSTASARAASVDKAETRVSSTAQRERVAAWRAAYEAATQERQRARDAHFTDRVKTIAEQLADLSKGDPALEGAMQALIAIDAQIRSMETEPRISLPAKEALAPTRKRADRLSAEWAALRNERERHAAREADNAQLALAVTSPAAYAAGLRSFVDRWPDDQRAAEYRRAAGDEIAWEMVTDWSTRMRAFSGKPLPTSLTQQEKLAAALDDHVARHPLSPYKEDALVARALVSPSREWESWVEEFSKSPYVGLGLARVADGKVWYTRRSDSNFNKNSPHQSFRVIHSVDTLNASTLKTVPTDSILYLGDSPQFTMMQKARAVLDRRGLEPAEAMIQVWESMAWDTKVDPILRLLLTQELMDRLRSSLPGSAARWDEFERAIATAAVPVVDWIAPPTASSESARRRAEGALGSAPTVAQLRADQVAAQASAMRAMAATYVPVGRIVRDDAGRRIEFVPGAAQGAPGTKDRLVGVVSRPEAPVAIVNLVDQDGTKHLDLVPVGTLVFRASGQATATEGVESGRSSESKAP
ncbi:MAG: hypothetical protein O2819_00205 [Planctomycetota bacterium]|nr:hypothetical protein [Planctomycetota bacterium]MDA1105368.1 hypothetical protein [Planctomycetota bacterium]